MSGIVGLDLSLRCTGVCWLPEGWTPGDWDAVETRAIGFRRDDRGLMTPDVAVQRLVWVVKEVREWVRARAPDRVFIESYAFGMAGRSAAIFGLAELGGAVKVELYRSANLVCSPMNASTARKYLLGKLPRKGAPAVVYEALQRMGARFSTTDQADAFVIANAGRAELGLPGVTLAEAARMLRAKRSRACLRQGMLLMRVLVEIEAPYRVDACLVEDALLRGDGSNDATVTEWGWWCEGPDCGVFNGCRREQRTHCRACGKGRGT